MDNIYDIRTSENALQTLTRLTKVPFVVWERYIGRERDYKYTDDLVEDVIVSNGHLPESYQDFEFVYFHVTTSSNDCLSYYKFGILDLKRAYLCNESELRQFLDKHNIFVDIDNKVLTHAGQEYDITFGRKPQDKTEAYYRWRVGRKFFYDYTTCGFLSVWERSAYLGRVHLRPEILMDIDDLLGLSLSKEWALTHSPYEVVAKVNGKNIVYDGDERTSDREKVLAFLTMAYTTAFGDTTEKILLIQNNVQIPPSDIIEIKRLKHWEHLR